MIIEIPNENSIVKWKNDEKDEWKVAEISDLIKAYEERPKGECRTCRHRDSEDKKCDCGWQERLGCPFPVRNDYYCKFYEKGCGAE